MTRGGGKRRVGTQGICWRLNCGQVDGGCLCDTWAGWVVLRLDTGKRHTFIKEGTLYSNIYNLTKDSFEHEKLGWTII